MVVQDDEVKMGDYAESCIEGDGLTFGCVKDPYEEVRNGYLVKPETHTLLLGQTGAGKTVMLKHLMSQISEQDSYLYTQRFYDETIDVDVSITEDNLDKYGLALLQDVDAYTKHKKSLLQKLIFGEENVSSIVQNQINTLIDLAIADPEIESLRDLQKCAEDLKSNDLSEGDPLYTLKDRAEEVPRELTTETVDLVLNDTEFSQDLNRVVRNIIKLGSNETVNSFSERGDVRTFSITNLIEGVSTGEKYGVFVSDIRPLFTWMYYLASDCSENDSYLFYDNVEESDMDVLSELLPVSRSAGLSIFISSQSLGQYSQESVHTLRTLCGNLIVLGTVDVSTGNTLSSMTDLYDRNHFINQSRYHFTAKIHTDYSPFESYVEGYSIPPRND